MTTEGQIAPGPVAADWIAVDWGTSALRAFAMRGAEVLAEAAVSEGMGKLSPEAFEPALLAVIGDWLGQGVTPVVACGMVGARAGWAEAPYRATPCVPVAAGETLPVVSRDPRIAVEIVPGLCQADPADVMRGEETQIAGFLAREPGFQGRLILPGTHSKHVLVAGGRVMGFTTWMTGELFALISRQSILRLTLQGRDEDEDGDAFAAGVRLGRAGQALAALFPLRAEALLEGLAPTAGRARLSGLLIGAELATVSGGETVVIGSGPLARRYVRALALAGVPARAEDGADLARRGLALARR